MAGGGGDESGGDNIGISSALLKLALLAIGLFSLDVAFVTGTLLAGPIGTGNLYLTKVEANGAPPSRATSGSGCGALLGNGNTPRLASLSSGGVSRRLVKRTGVGI